VDIQWDGNVSNLSFVHSFKSDYWSAIYDKIKNGKIKEGSGRKKSAKKASANQKLSQADNIVLSVAEGARPPKRKAAVPADSSEVRRSKRNCTNPQKSSSPGSEDDADEETSNDDRMRRRTRSNATYYTAST
jgi:hypothetical protein